MTFTKLLISYELINMLPHSKKEFEAVYKNM